MTVHTFLAKEHTMFGTNPIRAPEKGDGQLLQIQEIFPTLQGEGPYAGMPAVFVRLGGCNLACHFCDTEFESFNEMALDEVIEEIHALSDSVRNLTVITGGEPFRQNITPLCEQLVDTGYLVQIETNGTLYRELPEAVEIICSPKAPNGRYHPLRPDILARAKALKFIVSAEEGPYHQIAEVGQSEYGIPVYVQPMDEQDEEKNTANQAYALELAMKRGYRLSLQWHKILNIP